MKKRKGFTLIELLAVIVILAIIAVIATPIIVGIIEDSRKAAFERSVEGIMHALDLDFGMQEALDNFTYTIKDGIVGGAIRGYEIADFETCKNYLMNEFSEPEELAISDCNNEPNPYDGLTITEYAKDDSEFANTLVTAGVLKEIRDEVTVSNTNGFSGTIKYNENGKSSYAINNGKWCITKGYNDEKGTVSENIDDCILVTDKSCFTYTDFGENEYIITDYDISCGTNVIMPNTINDKIVTIVGTSAFENKGITTIKLNEGLEKIEEYAFFYNPITNINIPDTLAEIEDDTFYGLELSSTSEEYQKIISINSNAITTPTDEECFTYQDVEGGIEITDYSTSCPRKVVIPSKIDNKSVVSIGEVAFRSNLSESEISYNKLNKGIEFMSNDIELAIAEAIIGDIEKVIIPDTVTYIGGSAFLFNQISSVKFGNNVEYIGDDAFYYNLLTELELPASLANIGDYAFSSNKLESVIFVGRNNLDGVTLGDSVWGWAEGYSDANIGFSN